MKSALFTITIYLLPMGSFCQDIDSAQFYYNRGLQEKSEKLYAMASKNFENAIRWNPHLVDAYLANGRVNLEMSRIYAASQYFTKANQLEPGNHEIIKELSSLYFNAGQYQKAIDFAIECNDCDNANRILGISYFNLGDYANAEKYLKIALTDNEEDAASTYALARTYLELENEKQVVPLFLKAIALNPKNSQWLYELGMIYYTQNDYRNALQYFDMAASNGYTKSNDFLENYGFAQLYTGDVKNGIETLNTILERKPNNRELLNNIAYAMYDTKKYNEALDYFKKLLDLNPKDASSLFMAGLAFQKLGQKQKGQSICESAIAMDPSLAGHRQKKELPAGL